MSRTSWIASSTSSAVGSSPSSDPRFGPAPRSVSERRDQQRLDRVHAVLRLIEYDRRRRFEHLIGDLHGVQTELLADAGADLGLAIVERRQAVHELDARIAGRRHDLGRN